MLKDYTIDELVAALMTKCGFRAVIFPIELVSVGFMHRMYRTRTKSGIYAVKHLNPEIMGREGVHDNFDRAEKRASLPDIICVSNENMAPKIICGITVIHG